MLKKKKIKPNYQEFEVGNMVAIREDMIDSLIKNMKEKTSVKHDDIEKIVSDLSGCYFEVLEYQCKTKELSSSIVKIKVCKLISDNHILLFYNGPISLYGDINKKSILDVTIRLDTILIKKIKEDVIFKEKEDESSRSAGRSVSW